MTTVVLEHLQHANSGSPDLTVSPTGNIGIGTANPSTTASGYDGGSLHIHNDGTGSSIRLTNSTTGTGTSDGMLISKWNDSKTYFTNFDNGANTVFTQSNTSGTLITTLVMDGDGRVGIGTSSPTTSSKLHITDGDVQIALEGTGGSNKGYINFDGTSLQMSTNRDLKTGAFANSSKSNATMMMRGLAGGSEFRFYTTTSNNTTATNRMTITKEGYTQTPYQPSFSSIKNTHQYPVSGSRTVITPWTSNSNIGGHFNNSTGVFTAPVSGTYFFYISVMSDRNDTGDYQIAIFKNGSMYANSNDLHTANATYVQTTVPAIINLAANDTVDYRLYNSGSTSTFIYEGSYTHCGGYLIG